MSTDFGVRGYLSASLALVPSDALVRTEAKAIESTCRRLLLACSPCRPTALLSGGSSRRRRHFHRRGSAATGDARQSGSVQSIFELASSFAALPEYSSQGGRANAQAEPTSGPQQQQQQQRSPAVPFQRQTAFAASAAASSSSSPPPPARRASKRFGGWGQPDIGDKYAASGTQQATDAVTSVSNLLYGDDYAYGLARRHDTPIPSPTTTGEFVRKGGDCGRGR